MAPILFTERILAASRSTCSTTASMQRDFTYIDDIVEGVVRALDHAGRAGSRLRPANGRTRARRNAPYRVYNIGNDQPVELMRFIELLEQNLGCKVEKRLLPMQPGDVPDT